MYCPKSNIARLSWLQLSCAQRAALICLALRQSCMCLGHSASRTTSKQSVTLFHHAQTEHETQIDPSQKTINRDSNRQKLRERDASGTILIKVLFFFFFSSFLTYPNDGASTISSEALLVTLTQCAWSYSVYKPGNRNKPRNNTP